MFTKKIFKKIKTINFFVIHFAQKLKNMDIFLEKIDIPFSDILIANEQMVSRLNVKTKLKINFSNRFTMCSETCLQLNYLYMEFEKKNTKVAYEHHYSL